MSDALDTLRSRVKKLNTAETPEHAKSVLYVMSRDCRVNLNHALLAAQQQALKEQLPLVVAFVAYDKQLGNRAQEHIRFLLDGLQDVADELQAKNITFVLRKGEGVKGWGELVKAFSPSAIYFDFSPLRHSLTSKASFAEGASLPVFVVDTHNVIPVWVASDKQEVGARTLRPKIHFHLPKYLRGDLQLNKHPYNWNRAVHSELLGKLTDEICSVYPSNGTDISRFKPGEKAAQKALKEFIYQRLKGYGEKRNDPSVAGQSELNPYFHYGQLSTLDVAIAAYDEVKHDGSLQADADKLIEEMIVRKELADNYCYYNPHYNQLSGAPEWAQKTLAKHAKDPREFTYTRKQFEEAETHDEAWNAAQLQLKNTGKIHGYMRMYWAKKVIEWSASPEEALEVLLYMNDFYHIDGGDPNGYVGILWSVAGLHDRPWGERPVYGVIRSMVYGGLKRKFDIQKYIDNQTKTKLL